MYKPLFNIAELLFASQIGGHIQNYTPPPNMRVIYTM